MSSLTDVVKAMSMEMENSTLDWDVVVNYTCVTASMVFHLTDSTFKSHRAEQLAQGPIRTRRRGSAEGTIYVRLSFFFH